MRRVEYYGNWNKSGNIIETLPMETQKILKI
jgi:hypothetical protein